ncbi:MAG: DUF3795 domain-containing protein [Clostridiales bacterium]|nr:DUF3795 domain-containing protein [Clostridiales bacterium]
MQWYIDRLEALSQTKPILSVCGDDCAVCPRYLAQTEDELQQTAIFWHKAGWRDHVVSNEEIRCAGCGTRGACAFMLMPCLREKGLDRCTQCREHPCGKIVDMLVKSAQKEAQCSAACGDERFFAMMKRAFYEKEKNLGL